VHPAPPITGPAMDLSTVDTVSVHQPAGQAPTGDTGDRTDVAAYLRAIQTAYVRDRRYSIGYSFAIDHLGDVWELRGWDIRCAANVGNNHRTLALLLIVDQDEPATTAQLEAARSYVAELERRTGRAVAVTGHGQLPGARTACPGAGLRAQIAAGDFRPAAPPTPPTPGDETDMTTARMVRIRGTLNVFLVGTGAALHLTPELYASYQAAGVPELVVELHPQFAMSVLHQCGLEAEDLVPAPEAVR